MSSDSVFEGSIPDIYDDYLVPLIFEFYARDLAARAAVRNPKAVLEIAAGSGVVTREVAPLLDGSTRFVVTDLNEPMLMRAQSRQPDADAIEWLPADAQELPFADGSFDVVLCQFGAMFFPDRAKAYAEALRVLRPGGAFIFNMWDRIERNEFADVITTSLGALYPQNPPRFLARTPHGHYEPNVYRAELAATGFDEIAVDALETMSEAASAEIPAIAYCQGTPLRNEIEQNATPDLNGATAAAADAIRLRFGGGHVAGLISAFVVTAGVTRPR